jgi:hypothetical protein
MYECHRAPARACVQALQANVSIADVHDLLQRLLPADTRAYADLIQARLVEKRLAEAKATTAVRAAGGGDPLPQLLPPAATGTWLQPPGPRTIPGIGPAVEAAPSTTAAAVREAGGGPEMLAAARASSGACGPSGAAGTSGGQGHHRGPGLGSKGSGQVQHSREGGRARSRGREERVGRDPCRGRERSSSRGRRSRSWGRRSRSRSRDRSPNRGRTSHRVIFSGTRPQPLPLLPASPSLGVAAASIPGLLPGPLPGPLQTLQTTSTNGHSGGLGLGPSPDPCPAPGPEPAAWTACWDDPGASPGPGPSPDSGPSPGPSPSPSPGRELAGEWGDLQADLSAGPDSRAGQGAAQHCYGGLGPGAAPAAGLAGAVVHNGVDPWLDPGGAASQPGLSGMTAQPMPASLRLLFVPTLQTLLPMQHAQPGQHYSSNGQQYGQPPAMHGVLQAYPTHHPYGQQGGTAGAFGGGFGAPIPMQQPQPGQEADGQAGFGGGACFGGGAGFGGRHDHLPLVPRVTQALPMQPQQPATHAWAHVQEAAQQLPAPEPSPFAAGWHPSAYNARGGGRRRGRQQRGMG